MYFDNYTLTDIAPTKTSEPSPTFKDMSIALTVAFSYQVKETTTTSLNWYDQATKFGGGLAATLVILQYVVLPITSLYLIYKVIGYLRERS